MRAAVSEGLSVITHAKNVAFFREAMTRAHTIVPDALAKNQKPLTIEGVEDEKTLEDSAMTINLYHIAGNPHGERARATRNPGNIESFSGKPKASAQVT